MSAIAGIFHKDKRPIPLMKQEKLMKSFQRFPVDAIDTWECENVFFGCYFQAITKESVREALLYYDKRLKLAITADAILDNRSELFERLHIPSHERKTIPDSQLILLAYEKWQDALTQYVYGDFAFVIWDERNEKLFGARDFSGSRTLYYYDDDEQFLFSTTIEALFNGTGLKKELHAEWLAQFLAIRTIVEATDMHSTVYQSIRQVPPSHTILVERGQVRLERYHVFKDEKLKLRSNDEYEAALRDVLQKAVQARIHTWEK